MGFLNRKFQKVLLTLLLTVSGSVLFTLHYHDYDKDAILDSITSTSTKTLDDLTYQVLYYQELMKNYTSTFYDEPAGTSLDPLTSNTNEKFRSLLTPLLVPNSLSPKEVLQENVKLVEDILSQKIDEPKDLKLVKISENPDNYKLENATFVSLVRNSELAKLKGTIKQIESTFNDKYHYPYVFLNEEPFTDRFKSAIQQLTKSECFFEQVSTEEWYKPSSIDKDREKAGIKYLEEKGVGYAAEESYHNMCRYYSSQFYNHPTMQKFKYYWRIEPNTNYFCDIDYDVFKFMKDNDKVYGFVLNLYDSPDSVKTLWPTTIEFLAKNPTYLHPNAASNYLRENLQNPGNFKTANGYSTCHFWSNFEIGDMDFYRGEAYSSWVKYLNEIGGFYYERWGDAPVHSIGVSLFADKSRIHWFRDIGYEHFPYLNCPNSDKCGNRCKKGMFSKFDNLNNQNCLANYIKYEMTDDELNYY